MLAICAYYAGIMLNAIATYRKTGNSHVKIIHVLNIHMDLFLWFYGTHENILT